jgi:hypothetical protein
MRLALILVAAGIVLGACARTEPPVLMEVAQQPAQGPILTESGGF